MRSEKDFILSYCCPLPLEEFYKSKVVTFPESLSRQMFCIRGYDKHQEIPRRPQSIIYQMDRDIVQQEALKEDGEHSKLWCYEQALEIVIENMGADKIQSIILLSPESKPTNVQAKEKKFLEMENLTLIIGNVQFHGHLEFLPNGFRQLDWDKYPFSWWPAEFFPKKLVVLKMYLNLSVIYVNSFKSVRYVDFSSCKLIRKIPDLSLAPNIKELYISCCENLVEVDDSMGRLDKLEVLDVSHCDKLQALPSCLKMKSLRYFGIFGCWRLKKFPNILHEMKGIRELQLGKTEVIHLPRSIYNLQHLETLILEGNIIFPKGFSNYGFPRLRNLFLYCLTNRSEIDFIFNCCCPRTLEVLEIGSCKKIVSLPESISRFERLHRLREKMAH
ncbi:hypothetical protein ACB092_03G057100 [Castanea dentata]